jgi:hypothetical protein
MSRKVKVLDNIPEDRWKDIKLVSVDIETGGEDPLGEDGLNEWGLSFNAEVTDVALINMDTYEAVVFQNPSEKEREFVKEILSKDHITIIGHNVVFDLRQLGGHYGFLVARHSLVWDTMTVGAFLLMKDEYGAGMSLMGLSTRLGIKPPYNEEFLEFMKTQRSNFGNVVDILYFEVSKLPPTHGFWKEVGGYLPPLKNELVDVTKSYLDLTDEEKKNVDEKDEAFFTMWRVWELALKKYVLSDTIMAADIYDVQKDVSDRLENSHVTIGNWYKVPIWPSLPKNFNMLLRNLRVSANQSIRGIPLDLKYANKLEKEFREKRDKNLKMLRGAKDESDPYPNFNEVLSTLYYFSRVLDVCANSKKTYSNPTGWKFWRHVKLNRTVVKDALIFAENCDEEEWVDFLLGLDPVKAKRNEVLKTAPKTIPPALDLVSYVHKTCYSKADGSEGRFRAELKARWWVDFYTAKKSEDKSMEDMYNKKSYTPYYLFVVGNMPLCSQELLDEFPKLLLTRKGMNEYMDNKRAGKKNDVNYFMKKGVMSYSTKALRIYNTTVSEDDDRYVNVNYRRDYLAFNAKHKMVNELLLHARKDGRIHPINIPAANTTRDKSSLPNTQNLNMYIMRGVLVGDPGSELVELDLSNAENKTGAMTAGDSLFAWGTEEGDFHATQAANYFGKRWERANADERKTLRSWGKSITFGTAYGMGFDSLVVELREKGVSKEDLSADDIREILLAKERAYPKVVQKKTQVINEAKIRHNAGFMPPYVPLWNGVRVQVTKNREYGTLNYKNCWNYKQQGGVAVMIHPSMVEFTEWAEDNNYKSWIVENVHDSHITMTYEEEADIILPENARLMGNQVPEELCRRTTPKIHFVAHTGPENAEKWGYRADDSYCLPKDKFWNEWGTHDMPEGMDESPTWCGPIHEGWTLKGEIKAIENGLRLDEEYDGQVHLEMVEKANKVDDGDPPCICDVEKALKSLDTLSKGQEVTLPGKDGGTQKRVVPYDKMPTLLSYLATKGHNLPVEAAAENIKNVLDQLGKAMQFLAEEQEKLTTIYEQLPNSPEPVSSGD